MLKDQSSHTISAPQIVPWGGERKPMKNIIINTNNEIFRLIWVPVESECTALLSKLRITVCVYLHCWLCKKQCMTVPCDPDKLDSASASPLLHGGTGANY